MGKRPIHTLKLAINNRIANRQSNQFNSTIISVHACDRFVERVGYLGEFCKRHSTEKTIREFQEIYLKFTTDNFYDNLMSLFNMAVEIELDAEYIKRNKKRLSNAKVKRVSIYDFMIEDDVVKTILFNGHFSHLNKSRK